MKQTHYSFVLNILKIDPSTVPKGNITITGNQGYLSSNSQYESLVKPFNVSITNLETLKMLTGGMTYQIDSNESFLNLPEPWPEAKNAKSFVRLNQQEDKNIRKALIAAAFGYHDRVRSYDQIFQQSFPMEAIAYAGESITIKKGQILTIEPTGHDPVFVVYQTITLEEGGQIQCQAPVVMSAEKFIKTNAL